MAPTLVTDPVETTEELPTVESFAFNELASSIASARKLIEAQKALEKQNREIENQLFTVFGERTAYAKFCLPQGMSIEQALRGNFQGLEDAVKAITHPS